MFGYPHVKQHEKIDCGAACLGMICEYYGRKSSLGVYREMLKTDINGVNLYGMVDAAKKLGLDAQALKGDFTELLDEIHKKKVKFPFIANVISDENCLHYIVVYKITRNYILIGDPAKDVNKISVELFKQMWTGYMVNFTPNKDFERINERKKSMKKFFDIVSEQSGIMLAVIILSIIISGISMLGSLIFEYIVDDVYSGITVEEKPVTETIDRNGVLSNKNSQEADSVDAQLIKIIKKQFPSFSMICIAIIILYLFQIVIKCIRDFLTIAISKKINLPILSEYYEHVLKMPIGFFESRQTGDIMSRFTDASSICQTIANIEFSILIDGMLVLFYGAFMFNISNVLFGISIIIMLIYSMLVFLFKKPLGLVVQDLMSKGAQVNSYIKESIDGIATIKSFSAEENFISRGKKLLLSFVNLSVKESFISIIEENIVIAITSIGVIIILWSGVTLTEKGMITCGTLITFYVMLGNFLSPIQNLINLQPQIQTLIVIAERVNDIMELDIEVSENGNNFSLNENLKINDITFRYGNGNEVLKDLSMSISKGSKVAIVGESGCGKTTLVKLLLGFYEPEKGSILFGEKILGEFSKKYLREEIAYVSQEVYMFSDTLRNNILLNEDNVTDEEIMEICKRCCLDEFVQRLPLGLDTNIEENGNNLSGGEKQRLAIVRALIKKPSILILDEATSNLDVLTEKSIINTIGSLKNDITIIIIAHRLSTVLDCDNIFLLENGRVVANGTHLQMMNSCREYKKYWEINNGV